MTALLFVVRLTVRLRRFLCDGVRCAVALLACAFQPADRYGGLLSFGHAMFLGTRAMSPAHALKVWGVTPELGIRSAPPAPAGLGVITGLVAIRRQGNLFLRMTQLALSAASVFHLLQTPFTHGEDGSRAFPQGAFRGFSISENSNGVYLRPILAVSCSASCYFSAPSLAISAKVLNIDPRKRAAAISLGYDRPVQAAGYILSERWPDLPAR